MPSARRLRFLLVVVMAVVITSLFFTSRFGAGSEKDAARSLQDFYGRTVNAMDRKRGSGGAQIIMDGKGSTSNGAVNDAKDKDGDGTVSEGDVQMAQEMQERLRAAEQKAKEQANKKAPLRPDSPSNVIGVGSSAGGQVQKPAGKDADASSAHEDSTEPPEDRKVEVTLNEMFKRSPGKSTMDPRGGVFACSATNAFRPQSSSSPSRIAPFRRKPRRCFWTNTPSILRPTWSSSTSTPSGNSCRKG